MDVRGALSRAQNLLDSTVWKATTIVRVGLEKGITERIRWPGARVLLEGLPRGRTGPSLLFRFLARNDPHRIALIDPRSLVRRGDRPEEDRHVSFFEMNDVIDRAAVALARRGVGPGGGALLMLKNRPEFVMLQPAVNRAGGAAVAASWRSTAPELQYLARHSGARALLFDADVAAVVREAAPGLPGIPRENMISVGGAAEGFPAFEDLIAEGGGDAPDRSEDAAVVMYTSGTTGKPKGAVRKYPRDALASTLAFLGETPMRYGEVHLAVCPLYHATAHGFIALSYILGATVVVLPEFRPDLFLEAIQRYRVTSTAVVPTMLHRLLELGEERIRAYDTSSLRAIFCGGAQLPAQLALDVMNVLGDKLYNFYGSTETGLVTIASPDDLRASPGTIGRPVPGTEILVLDASGRPCREGEVGELYARSSMMIEGYHDDPEATRGAQRDGFFSVGDLARRDRRGCWFIEGRKRDMIISGGVNVYPAEIEEVLHTCPGVAEAAVVGAPDPEWGERVRAFVVPKPGAAPDEDALRAFCRARLSGAKVPRDFVFLDALPRNPTGKVLKRELAAMGGAS